MADDLDQLIRAAMKTLDEQVPSGYFEALPNQTLARLEGSMQHGSSGTTDTRDASKVPPMTAAPNEPDTSPVARQPEGEEREDSGLHDIRNLAQSTKQRLSGRKITSQPFADDVLASSSGSFKNIALPQPAKMVSLPTIEELPSKAEIAAAERAAKKAAKEAKKAEPVVAAAAPALEATIKAPGEAPVAPSASMRQAFSLPSQQRKGSKGPLLAILGFGVAAAAGYVIFLQVNKDSAKESSSAKAATAAAEQADVAAGSAQTVTAQPIETTPPPAAAAEPAPVEAPKDEAAAGAAQLATDDMKDAEAKASDKKKPSKATKGSPKTKVDKEEPQPKKEEQKAPDKNEKTKPVATKGGETEGEPSFDALLKEAGVSDQKKDTKPKLDKKSLTGDDFKKAMGAVEGKAKDCYKGTQGTALVKLTVAPSGSINKITVTGDFAGKPEASCVQSAIKAATFPPWDGGPQTFTYAVLLSD